MCFHNSVSAKTCHGVDHLHHVIKHERIYENTSVAKTYSISKSQNCLIGKYKTFLLLHIPWLSHKFAHRLLSGSLVVVVVVLTKNNAVSHIFANYILFLSPEILKQVMHPLFPLSQLVPIMGRILHLGLFHTSCCKCLQLSICSSWNSSQCQVSGKSATHTWTHVCYFHPLHLLCVK